MRPEGRLTGGIIGEGQEAETAEVLAALATPARGVQLRAKKQKRRRNSTQVCRSADGVQVASERRLPTTLRYSFPPARRSEVRAAAGGKHWCPAET